MIAVNPTDPDWCGEVARNFETMDGAVEEWRCPECEAVFRTKMLNGKRTKIGYLFVRDEKKEPVLSRRSGLRV